ncbi:SpoIID/LytB domain-containing protein [Conexibacter sp. CPCC 206217]|uniref:SpoIID/LytB domain-containing protein n=1 Tax=Conexibacter sp. CPCC 206217 TaxID=3064574 RepID=UPI0027235B7C|nr:SpoIID/LytB domain-containing protein [Conexibacter sp. CPCC 206217]MDO8210611.1 SpoIID/LytB domain-containing protein [Conexibacter sp. CPCC 206217]
MLRTFRLTPLLVIVAACFAVAPAGAAQRLVVRGAGFGHGVGMSQYGAQGYALQGANYRTILAHYYAGTRLGRVPASSVVRVLLRRGRTATFTGATRAGRSRLNAATTYRAALSGSNVVLAGGGRTVRVAQRARIAGPGPLTVGGGLGRYRGTLELSRGDDGGLQVVNAVGIEDYVRGVVSAEMYASWLPDALRAQAVAARTYALTIRKGDDGFDHFNDTSSQVYGGVRAETAATDAAVAATRLQVVTYRGRAVPTYFYASSGGRTENAEVGFAGSSPEPWLVGVADPYDLWSGNPYRSWTRSFTVADAERRLGSTLDGSLVAIRVLRRGFSGRVVSAEVVGSDGATTVTGDQLAAAFGLWSTWASYTLR